MMNERLTPKYEASAEWQDEAGATHHLSVMPYPSKHFLTGYSLEVDGESIGTLERVRVTAEGNVELSGWAVDEQHRGMLEEAFRTSTLTRFQATSVI